MELLGLMYTNSVIEDLTKQNREIIQSRNPSLITGSTSICSAILDGCLLGVAGMQNELTSSSSYASNCVIFEAVFRIQGSNIFKVSFVAVDENVEFSSKYSEEEGFEDLGLMLNILAS